MNQSGFIVCAIAALSLAAIDWLTQALAGAAGRNCLIPVLVPVAEPAAWEPYALSRRRRRRRRG